MQPLAVSAEKYNNSINLNLGVTALDFDYEEFSDLEKSLNREQGWLPGTSLGLNYESQTSLILDARLRWLSGTADYSSPVADSNTDEEILDLSLAVRIPLHETPQNNLYLSAGGGYRKWWRNIRSTQTAFGLDEVYRWKYLSIGFKGEHLYGPKTAISGEINLRRTINPEMSVDFQQTFDDANLSLKEKNGFHLSFGLTQSLSRNLSIEVSPWFEYWALGRSDNKNLTSNGVVVGSVFEPRSETHNWGIDFNLQWRFNLNN